MSYENGISALHLEKPDKIPRTEYSAEFHWELIQKVTGLPVSSRSLPRVQAQASREFIKAWDYGFYWHTIPPVQQLGDMRTSMGHASYRQDAADFSSETSLLLQEPEDVFRFNFWEAYGKRDAARLAEDFSHDYEAMASTYPDTVNMTGIYATCMSGAIEILGWDMLLLAAGTDQKLFGEFMERYTAWNLQYFEALAQCSAPVVMVHDDLVWTSGAFLAPEFYRTFLFPCLKKLIRPLLDCGKRVLFTSDGNFTQFAADIAACGVHGFVLEPCTDLAYLCEAYGQTHVIVGNVDTRVLLMGQKDEIEAEVKRCISLGKNCPGYFMAVGNHIPPNTPVDNCLYYNEFYEAYSRR